MDLKYRLQQLTWGKKTIFYIIVALAAVMLFFTLLLETTHDGFTPNVNRYPASFSITNINWFAFILFLLTYYLLLLPWYKFCFGNKFNFKGISIFPGTSSTAMVFGTLLTIWSVFTGGLFSLTYCLFSLIAHQRHVVLMDDEYPVVILAYILGVIFWGTVDLIYWIKYWKKDKAAQFNPFEASPEENMKWFDYQNNH